MPRDEVTSQRWMVKSAEQGYVPAETMIGCSYLNNHTAGAIPNYAEGEKWLLSAATHGDAEAQFWLGLGYDRGYLGRTDFYQESLGGSDICGPRAARCTICPRLDVRRRTWRTQKR